MRNAEDRKRIIVAGAGTGKTTLLRNIAVESNADKSVLYLTYTDANASEFRAAVIDKLGHLPANITIMTWFSFLLAHGVRPFPAQSFTHRVDRMLFNNREPHRSKGVTRGMEEYFCARPGVVYRTSLADLAVYCNEQWGGEVIHRICAIYDVILVDEAQDFAGYDYDFILEMMNNTDDMVVVGDPRQQTYRTGWKAKYKNLHDIFKFFERNTSYDLDTTTLSVTHRCSADVMRYANLLYPEYQSVRPSDERLAKPKGRVAVLEKKDFAAWIAARTEKPTVLTWNNTVADTFGCHRMNMGESKGLTLGDVAIFTTGEMKKWIQGKPAKLPDSTKAKLYVALTRASGDLYLVI